MGGLGNKGSEYRSNQGRRESLTSGASYNRCSTSRDRSLFLGKSLMSFVSSTRRQNAIMKCRRIGELKLGGDGESAYRERLH